MLLNVERVSFIHWVLRYHLFESAAFYFNKLIFKTLRLISRNKKSYPEIVKKFIHSEYQFDDNPVLDKYSLPYNDLSKISIDFIDLAGSKLKINEGVIGWLGELDDPEDEESLHRWNWAIYKLSIFSEKDKIELASWVFSQQESWLDSFQHELLENSTAGKLRWESYTVGERIANSIIFYHHVIGAWPSVDFSKAIKAQVRFLIHHLEYFGDNTGNHVVNNARAIYLAGVVFGCVEWRSLAFTIIDREISIVVTSDGFMREGSSHYQFLFTRWMLEVYYFASVINDKSMMFFLSPYLKLLIQQCHFFLTYNKIDSSWEIPLFGDISPDFPPRWLLYLPWSGLASSFVAPPDKNTVIYEDCWNFLWNNISLPESGIKALPEHGGQNTSISYPRSGWFRVDYGENRLFYRVDRDVALDYVGHHHQDLYHFCLYRKGIPIFVDAGRKNYDFLPDSYGKFGISPRAHNSVMVDGVGSLPESSGRYPKKYIKTENITEIEQLKDSVLVTIRSNCFQRLVSPVTLTRKIYINSDSFEIEDEFLGNGIHDISTFFHFGSNIILNLCTDNNWELKSGGINSIFDIKNEYHSQVTHYHGDDSYLGLFVPAYGETVAASTLEITNKVQLPVKLKYKLSLGV